jgi:hypothetical protein
VTYVTHDSATDRPRGGSELCLACGLCGNGALHVNVNVRPEHLRVVRTLGLTIEKTNRGFEPPRFDVYLEKHFRLPEEETDPAAATHG